MTHPGSRPKIRQSLGRFHPRDTAAMAESSPERRGVSWSSGRAGIEQGQQRDFLSLGAELPGHLVYDHPAEGVAAEEIGAERLDASDLREVSLRHLRHGHSGRPPPTSSGTRPLRGVPPPKRARCPRGERGLPIHRPADPGPDVVTEAGRSSRDRRSPARK